MKKILKRVLNCSCILLPLSSAYSLFSCNKQEETSITDFELLPEYTTIRPGEKILIRAIGYPSRQRISSLNWNIKNCDFDGLFISDNGELSADISLHIDDLKVVIVEATYKNDPSISQQVEISVLPKPTYDFQGFKNNEITYFGRCDDSGHSHPLCSMQFNVEKIGNIYQYSLPKPIDVFQFDKPPSGYTSLINFVPIISDRSYNYMKFEFDSKHKDHAIRFENYQEDTWTQTIPSLSIENASLLNEKINVYFACDPNIKLSIDFNTWQSNEQLTVGNFDYLPTHISDMHDIVYDEPGIYSTTIFCPASQYVGTYDSTLNTIYCYRNKNEYTQFKFYLKWREGLKEKELELLEEIQDMLTFNHDVGEEHVFDAPVEQLDLNHLRYHKFNLDYHFDLSKRKHEASYYGYNSLWIASLYAVDPLNSSRAAELDIHVDWC